MRVLLYYFFYHKHITKKPYHQVHFVITALFINVTSHDYVTRHNESQIGKIY